MSLAISSPIMELEVAIIMVETMVTITSIDLLLIEEYVHVYWLESLK